MTAVHTTYYLSMVEGLEKSDDPALARLASQFKYALYQIIEQKDYIEELQRQLKSDDPEDLRKRLQMHYGERVAPVSEYCQAFYDWVDALKVAWKEWEETPEDKRSWRSPPPLYELRSEIDMVMHLAIGKSSYLARRIYGGEKHRTRKCPIHQGHWAGLFHPPPPCGCDGTGWLPEGEPLEEPENVTAYKEKWADDR